MLASRELTMYFLLGAAPGAVLLHVIGVCD